LLRTGASCGAGRRLIAHERPIRPTAAGVPLPRRDALPSGPYAMEAAKMLSIEASSAASNSASVC